MRTLKFLPVLLSLVLAGCLQQIAVDSLTGIMQNGFEVLNEESDMELAGSSIASNLKLLESVLRTDPGNRDLLLMACRGYASYAMGFVEDDDPVRARVFYNRGKDFGLRILTERASLRRALTGNPAGLRAALDQTGSSLLPAIFWTALSWGGSISLDLTNPDALADLPKVETMMEFVRQRDPGYFYGGADFFLGTIKGSRPAMLGGDPAASRAHFEAALAINGGKFLLTYVYYARTYAVQTQDSSLFLSLLDSVDAASPDILPEARLSNTIAKKKAGALRLRAFELF